MSWKKYFTPPSDELGNFSPLSNSNIHNKAGPARTNYSSFLPDIYTGSPNRIERYQQYDVCDSDSEVNAALDILAEFCTDKPKRNRMPLKINWLTPATNSEVKIIGEYLNKWVKLNKFDLRIFRIVRNVFKYGDAFFIRDPETQQWNWVDSAKIVEVIANESDGKKPEQYIIRDIAPNFMNLVATRIQTTLNPNPNGSGVIPASGQNVSSSTSSNRGNYSNNASRFGGLSQTEYAIAAEHVIHLSLSEGMDNNFPFGNSLLESIFKVYKQKELLEDAILIYRIQRAPERRVFSIDTAGMPPHLAQAFVERIKNEIHQRRIPSQSGMGENNIDSAYRGLAISDDFFFPVGADGRGSSVTTLAGGSNIGEITDLRYFTNKLYRGLRIPSSYLPTGADDSQSNFNDGRVGTAYIQELRFNKYCERLQDLISPIFDSEFKMYLMGCGINIDANLFELSFNPPLNFAASRQRSMDAEAIGTFTTIQQIPFISNRFAMTRFLGLTEDELAENERMWAEENGNGEANETDSAGEMRSAGLSAAGIQGDLGMMGNMNMPSEMEGQVPDDGMGGINNSQPMGTPSPTLGGGNTPPV